MNRVLAKHYYHSKGRRSNLMGPNWDDRHLNGVVEEHRVHSFANLREREVDKKRKTNQV